MGVKKCCVKNCKSCSTRREDFGVTYHKYPKDATIREVWAEATHYKVAKIELTTYVCSRHFRKSDFQIYKDSKYVLKSDAIPSIFSWMNMEIDISTSKLEPQEMPKDVDKSEKDGLNDSKESDGENVEAIRKFIEQQEIELEEKLPKNNDESISVAAIEISKDSDEAQDDNVTVATCMLDVILAQSEEQIAKKNDDKPLSKQSLSPLEKGNNTMALSVGSKVEAKDFAELWYPAQIMEVDYDEMEVLVHYENESKKHDEWISVSSPRLRPIGSSSASSPTTVQEISEIEKSHTTELAVKEEPKVEEKPKLKFVVGERCLARWRDNRRFIATISKDLGDGKYEIFFDDGFQWKCTTSRLQKYKDSISVDTSQTPNCSTPSPLQHGAGPSSTVPFPGPAYHTHLFDPNRDYLGSKSERREMKRKLNIKEIFNIGQKRPKKEESKDKPAKVVKKQRKVVKKKVESEPVETPVKAPVKKEIPEAVASIIGTVEEEVIEEPKIEIKTNLDLPDASDLIQLSDLQEDTGVRKEVVDSVKDDAPDEPMEVLDVGSATDTTETVKSDEDSSACIPEEEIKLEKFEKEDDMKHGEVIDKIKEVITKIEDDLYKVDTHNSPKVEIKEEPVKTEESKELPAPTETSGVKGMDRKEKLSKIKKGKKLRLLQEKKVKRQVEKVKSELEEMKKQVEEMRKQMMMKTEELEGQRQSEAPLQMPETFLLPGEWCAKWVNGQPVGKVSEVEPDHKEGVKAGLPRRSVQVEDKRLPEGWTKHMVRRSFGHSAGKWNVVLVSPDNMRFHTKADMRNYFENNPNNDLMPYEHALMDFGLHLKLSRRMGWFSTTPGGATDTDVVPLPAGTLSSTSPLVKRRKLSLKKPQFSGVKGAHKSRPHSLKIKIKNKKRKLPAGVKMTSRHKKSPVIDSAACVGNVYTCEDPSQLRPEIDLPLEDGYVYVGSLKVQIIDNLLRCPAEGCLKNFRNNTLLQMHIKHYHRELCERMGRTPKVLDLAYARTMPTDVEQPRAREPDLKTIKVKIPRHPKRDALKQDINLDLQVEIPTTPVKESEIPKQDSPKLRTALSSKPVKRPRVLLPVRRVEPEIQPLVEELEPLDLPEKDSVCIPPMEVLDFETAISTHTVTKPLEKKMHILKGPMSEDEEWGSVTSDVETRSSFPRSGTPDSKSIDIKPVSSESNEERRNSNMYMYTENGERIKIVHMKREEIINCHCGIREEDGLMVQCELCLCWQHALCHNIQKESEVPEKYTCSICLNPRRARRSQRFLHDQDRLYEGLLPGAKPCESLRRSHELSGNLLRIQDALHALRVKYYVATKKDHPKLYLWAKDWDNADVNFSQERLNSDYSDLNIIVNSIGKENLPLKDDQLDGRVDEDHDRYPQRDGLGPTVLSGLLSSPTAGSLDLPISTSDLERLAKSVQEQDGQRVVAPQPEAAIENNACRERLLRHIQRCQALIDARLDSIEAQVAELESQDPSFEDDETADYFPRTKQTIQMLMRDLDNMEELGAS